MFLGLGFWVQGFWAWGSRVSGFEVSEFWASGVPFVSVLGESLQTRCERISRFRVSVA